VKYLKYNTVSKEKNAIFFSLKSIYFSEKKIKKKKKSGEREEKKRM
jgi:hypothetical protein